MTIDTSIADKAVINELRNDIEDLKHRIDTLRNLMASMFQDMGSTLRQTRFDLWERTSENRQIAQKAKETLDNEFGRKMRLIDLPEYD